jgi:hypothetical protein
MKQLTSYKLNTRLLAIVNTYIKEHSDKNRTLIQMGVFSTAPSALMEAWKVRDFLMSNPEQSALFVFVFSDQWDNTSALKQTMVDSICRSFLTMSGMERLNERLESFHRFNPHADHAYYLKMRNQFIVDEICISDHRIDILDKINSI